MNSLIIKTTARGLMLVVLIFSFFLLLRGHNAPGGGFIAGLVTAAALVLYTIAFGHGAARPILRLHPNVYMGVGLLIALASSVICLVGKQPFFTGVWVTVQLQNFSLPLGTPLLFDLGVYCVVVGATVGFIFYLEEVQQRWKS